MIAFIDFETNGFQGSSVLSVCAEREDGEIFARYYYPNPEEEYNEKAIQVNGLTKEKVDELRGDATYSKYFKDDADFIKFMEPVNKLVAHNIWFDYSFIPEQVKEHINGLFCTMKSNTKYFSDGKWPKLEKCASLYDIPIEQDKLHDASYDIYLCKKIFNAMPKEDIDFHFEWLTKR